MEQGRLFSEKENLQKNCVYNKVVELGNVPELGMTFESEEKAYDYYNLYAEAAGFSIRKHYKYTRAKDKKNVWRIFCCSCEGKREKHSFGTPKKARAQTRFDCKANMKITLVEDSGNYLVTELVEIHTHALAPPDIAPMLRSHRSIRPTQQLLISSLTNSGIGPSEIYHYCAEEAGGYDHLNFSNADIDNLVQRRRRQFLKEGDGAILIQYFRRKQKENSSFYYDIQVDNDNQIRTCFWCDAKSRIDYECFGDVVSFDTTYKTNDYDMPFAPFVGVNYHKQTIIFSSALVSDETTETFVWVFKQFFQVMGEKAMKTIFTDQAPAIGNAIKQVFPHVHHRLCIWHIHQNALRNLSHVFTKYESFNGDFKSCIYEEIEEEFFSKWTTLLGKYGLEENKWMQSMFDKKEKWAQVYGRQNFCASMASTQRSESMNNYFKKYFKRKQILGQFMTQYDKALSLRRRKEKDGDLKSSQTEPNLTSKWAVERFAREFYTRKMFSIFQEELGTMLDLGANNPPESDDSPIVTYDVESLHNRRVRRVEFNRTDHTARCSCQLFQFTGMPCGHMLKVWRMRNLPNLPLEYFLPRWSKTANPNIVIGTDRNTMGVDTNVPLSERFSGLSHMAKTLVTIGSMTDELAEVARNGLKRTIEEVETLRKASQEVVDSDDEKRDDRSLVFQETNTNQHDTVRAPPRKKSKGESGKRIQGFYDNMKKKGSCQRKTTIGKKGGDEPGKIKNKRQSTKQHTRMRGEDEANKGDICGETTLFNSSIQNHGVIDDTKTNPQVSFSYQQLLADQCATAAAMKLIF